MCAYPFLIVSDHFFQPCIVIVLCKQRALLKQKGTQNVLEDFYLVHEDSGSKKVQSKNRYKIFRINLFYEKREFELSDSSQKYI